MSVSSCSDDGRLFQALGPAQENERSPNFKCVRIVNCWWSADEDVRSCRLMRWRSFAGKMVTDEARPVWSWCISGHNLNTIRWSIGSQWRSFKVEVTWSRGPRRAIRRAAAFWTRCYGAMVDLRSPANTSLNSQVYWTPWRNEFSRNIRSSHDFTLLLYENCVILTSVVLSQ